MNRLIFPVIAILILPSICLDLLAEGPREIEPERSGDVRGKNLITLNGHFPFIVPANAETWRSRSDALRRRVRVATGLWPMPEKTPLNPVIHGKVERPGFSVEKVYFQSLPGHFVTGLLFRPIEKKTDQVPGVLSPHGHGGRLQRHSDQELAKQIAQGAEHFEASGRMPKLARCAQLARMGCVTFIFDMLGYADSIQISHQVAHRYQQVAADQESQSNGTGWGMYSPQADLRLQSIMGLQTWNAIRSLDFLASLPDVDPDRLAVTGGSGGGTQTILLGAIDDRVKVGFPNGMVSTSMQGGCYCENCNLLRIDSGNVELAALFAPRPQAMTAADDWTKEMMADGYPELRRIYAMTGNEQDVYCRPMLHFKHNYNYVTRATMYQWMNRHLRLGLDDPVIEQDFQPLTDEEMAVWNDEHPAPKETGFEHQRNVCRWLDQQANRSLTAIEPRDTKSLEQYRETVGAAWKVIFDQGLPASAQYERIGLEDQNGIAVEKGIVSVPGRNSALPVLTINKSGKSSGEILIWTDEAGKSAAFDEDGTPGPLLTQLADAGMTVLLPDLYHQGELLVEGVDKQRQPLIDDSRPYSAFTFCYNRTAIVQRAADLLAVISHAAGEGSKSVRLLGTGSAALWAAPAAIHAGPLVERVAIIDGSARFSDAESYSDVTFVPGAVKYGDLPALFALRAPHKLTVAADQPAPAIVKQAFDLAGVENDLHWEKANDPTDAILNWIQRK
jgi:dienelactone hydrolase